MKVDDVIECRGEYRAEDCHAVPDHMGRYVFMFEVGDPLPDVCGHHFDHPHVAKPGQNAAVKVVGIALACAGFHLMVGQPFFEHVPAEPLATARGVAHPAVGHPQLGTLPRLVVGTLGGEGACRPAVSLDVVV
jgi:hypothetical protein